MFRVSKVAMALAAAIPAGFSMEMRNADAQVPGWNIVRPTNCYEFGAYQKGQFSDTLYVYTNAFTVTLLDPAAIYAALYPCYTGAPFWAYYFGDNNWAGMIWINTGAR